MLANEVNALMRTLRESDEERAPMLVLSPTGACVNRTLVIRTLTEVSDGESAPECWRGCLYAGLIPIFVYAGQYPSALKLLERLRRPRISLWSVNFGCTAGIESTSRLSLNRLQSWMESLERRGW